MEEFLSSISKLILLESATENKPNVSFSQSEFKTEVEHAKLTLLESQQKINLMCLFLKMNLKPKLNMESHISQRKLGEK